MPSIQSEKGPLRPVTSVYVLHKIGLNVRVLQVFTFVSKCHPARRSVTNSNWTIWNVVVFVYCEMCLLKNKKDSNWVDREIYFNYFLIRPLKRKLPWCKLQFHWHFFSNETNNTSFQPRIFGNAVLCHIVVWML